MVNIGMDKMRGTILYFKAAKKGKASRKVETTKVKRLTPVPVYCIYLYILGL